MVKVAQSQDCIACYSLRLITGVVVDHASPEVPEDSDKSLLSGSACRHSSPLVLCLRSFYLPRDRSRELYMICHGPLVGRTRQAFKT